MATVHILSRGDTIGLTAMSEAGFTSLVAVSAMFITIFYKTGRQVLANPGSRLIRRPIDLYLLSLFTADMTQAFGSVLNVRWLHTGEVVEGNICTAQGALKQIGETAAAMTTLVIAIHTFVIIWWRKGIHALSTAKTITTVIWLYVILFTAIGIAKNKNHDYEVPTPYWCWIGEKFITHRILGEYLWLWLTLLFSIVSYFPLYFCTRGNITVDPNIWWKFQVHRVQDHDPHRSIALRFLAYPIVYLILVLPLSIVRWISFHQEMHGGIDRVPPPLTFTVMTIYDYSGILNVILLLYTRPNVFLLRRDASAATDIGHLPLQSLASLDGQPDMYEDGT